MIFFVDALGGIGKVFLFHTILATLRKAGHIVIATATSGIATTLIPAWSNITSHFKDNLSF